MTDAEARSQLPQILEEDWKVLGYVGLPERHMDRVGLSGDIHDLFEYTHEGRDFPIWIDQTRAQYDVLRGILKPVFRLATKILLSPASLDYFYYLVYAPRQLARPPVWYKDQQQVYEFRPDDTAKDERRTKARAALNRLAMVHTISFGASGGDEGFTVPSIRYFAEERVNIKDDTSTWSGIRPHTTIDASFVVELVKCSIKGKETEDRMLILGTRLAVCFIHEFVHGASLASNLKILDTVKDELTLRSIFAAAAIQRDQVNLSLNEDLFEDEVAAEPGFSWENFVFGGVVDTVRAQDPLTVTKWPNFLRGDQDLRRDGWKTSATVWIIPKQWVVNVNSQRWWDRVVAEDDDPLQIKRLIGYRRYHDSSHEPDNWSASQSEEGIFPTDFQRTQGKSDSPRVSKLETAIVVEDPSASRANEWLD